MSKEDVINRVREIHRTELKKSRAARPGVGVPGETEVRSPLESNRVKYNTWFYGSRVHGENFMWCAVYQSFVFASAKIPMSIYPKAAAVPSVRDFFKSRGRLFQTPMVGDLVIFIHSPRRRHIGFVEELLPDGRFHSIEGNVNSRVQRVKRRRGESGIVGYGRPAYEMVEEDDMTVDELLDALESPRGQAALRRALLTPPKDAKKDVKAGSLFSKVADIQGGVDRTEPMVKAIKQRIDNS
jgi:hypothetical protein